MDMEEPAGEQMSSKVGWHSPKTPTECKSPVHQECWEDSGYSSSLYKSHLTSVSECSKDTVESVMQCSDSGVELTESHFEADTESTSGRAWQSTPADRIGHYCSTPEGSHVIKLKSPSYKFRKSRRVWGRDLYLPNHKRLFDPPQSPITSDEPRPLLVSHVGRATDDVLSYLGKHSRIEPALNIILAYLEPADLCKASCVSKSWRYIIESNPEARERKKTFLTSHLQNKENLNQASKKIEEDPANAVSQLRGQLRSIQNINHAQESHSSATRSPPVSPSKVYHKKYIKAAQKLKKGQMLIPCPKCKLPSVPDSKNGALCTRGGCQFHFCIRCLCNFHGDVHCPVYVKHRRNQAAVGSTESRKNLRRL